MAWADPLIQPDRGQPARTLHVIDADGFDRWLGRQPPRARSAALAQGLKPIGYAHAILPGDGPDDWSAVTVVADAAQLSPWCLAKLADVLPAGSYRLAEGEQGAAALGWMLAQHQFTRYRPSDPGGARVLLTRDPARRDEAVRLAVATALVRDLVNTGAGDLGPGELEAEVERIAQPRGALITSHRGEQLEYEYPLIHAVGRAAARHRQPRLIELHWGDQRHPKVAVIGKGVCFDSGGLDLKPSKGMALMKKDMGGAAHALALAMLIIDAALPIRLHLLIPAVENVVSGDAFRPGDVLRSRAGLTVENTNTDAEGRLVLADALTRAGEEQPGLVIDFATLTGAARVALGPDLPAAFSNDDRLAAEFVAAADAVGDPAWRLPLWDGYDEYLKSDIADLVNASDNGFAGAVVAALFLRRFVPAGAAWLHLDTYAWRPVAKPGRPKGGDAYGLRACWELLKRRYGPR